MKRDRPRARARDGQAFSQQLFKQRSWGEMAESETYAHLEHLRLQGLAEARRERDGNLLYTTG